MLFLKILFEMSEPVAFQEQDASTSTVTVVESDEQVSKCKHCHYYARSK